jgi:hypothetical protein
MYCQVLAGYQTPSCMSIQCPFYNRWLVVCAPKEMREIGKDQEAALTHLQALPK